MSGIRIVPTGEEHVDGYRRCVGVVARERRYLAIVEEPAPEESRAYRRAVIAGGGVHLVAVDAAEEVVGWCNVVRDTRPGYEHGGRLGMGILPAHRGCGVGRQLLHAALDAARAKGFERVGLEVYTWNGRAVQLYEAAGFEREGLRRRVRRVDGEYYDELMMVRYLP